eukprot:859878-Pyramimonas_sp.AAC.1
MDSLDLEKGRFLFTSIQNYDGKSWIAYYSIHNYGLLREDNIRIAQHVLGKVQRPAWGPSTS